MHEDQRHPEDHGDQNRCRAAEARLTNDLVPHPEAEGSGEAREQHAGQEEAAIGEHDLAKRPGAGQTGRAVVEGHQDTDVVDEVSVPVVDG